MNQETMCVENQRQLAPHIYELTLSGELVKEMTTPGQFLHIRVPRNDLLLRRPISLANVNQENKTCQIIYRVEGDGTKVFSELKTGDLLNVLGPLGNGFPIDFVTENESILIVGGGIGIPPLYELGKQLHNLGANITFVLGYAKKELIYYEKEFQAFGEVHIATDDGSYGTKGHVGHVLDKLAEMTYQAIYACGAPGLLQAVEQKYSNHPHVYLSMEQRMACGVGACYACVCPSKKDPQVLKKVCDEGPIFKAGEVLI